MTEHQSEIFLTHLSAIATALTRIAETMSKQDQAPDKPRAMIQKREERPATAKTQERPATAKTQERPATAKTQERPATEKTQSDLSYDELASRLSKMSRDLDPGLFSKFMKGNILPKYAADGGGLSSINPEHFDDILAECADFYETRKDGEGAYQ